MTSPQWFKVGDRVRWAQTDDEEYQNAVGTIIAVIEADADAMFCVYDVRFNFAVRTLFGDQIELVSRAATP